MPELPGCVGENPGKTGIGGNWPFCGASILLSGVGTGKSVVVVADDLYPSSKGLKSCIVFAESLVGSTNLRFLLGMSGDVLLDFPAPFPRF